MEHPPGFIALFRKPHCSFGLCYSGYLVLQEKKTLITIIFIKTFTESCMHDAGVSDEYCG